MMKNSAHIKKEIVHEANNDIVKTTKRNIRGIRAASKENIQSSILNMDADSILKGFIFSEIFCSPKSKRKGRW